MPARQSPGQPTDELGCQTPVPTFICTWLCVNPFIFLKHTTCLKVQTSPKVVVERSRFALKSTNYMVIFYPGMYKLIPLDEYHWFSSEGAPERT